MSKNITEIIDSELKELVSNFMINTDLEIAALDAAFKKSDLATINRLGHNMKGSALNYGFIILAELGRSLERAALDEDIINIDQLLVQLKDYVARVEIVFEEK
ncbi:Hpt domain-containing protein [Maridesulfovibrio ferrireducens]|uniref:Hpt domain-containing protein n=1 Tax=Maridesulfovibrio ferrireducens TaxID=246191 RepID=UPI001A1FAB7A|nr:Hpt domain-containing protein [Maridesulfovibrio ferrireducens]MBI9110370.1 Hpt domain-containing protein [Maridesulfovibrio ferrireducens]